MPFFSPSTSPVFDLATTPVNRLASVGADLLSQVPALANSALLVDSVSTTGRAGMNFCYANNIVARTCFATSCICGTVGAISFGTAIASSFFGIPAAGVVGNLGARAFHRLGKYSLTLGNFTNGNFTNATAISELMN